MFSNNALGCKICIPNYRGRQKEGSSKKAEDVFLNANYMNHLTGSVFFKIISRLCCCCIFFSFPLTGPVFHSTFLML